MKRKITAIFVTLFLLTFVLGKTVFAQSSTPEPNNSSNQKNVVLPSSETVDHDYFAAGSSVTLSGTVNGDAYVAGGNILVDGTVNGDLLVAGGNINVNGNITGNIRAIGGQILINGKIGGNASAFGGSTNIVKGAQINGSFAGAGGNLDISGPLGKGVNGAFGNVTLGNTIAGNVLLYAGNLTLAPQTNISGNLEYYSNTEANLQAGSTVSGQTIRHNLPQQLNKRVQPQKAAAFITQALLFLKIMAFISYLLAGLLLIRFFPKFSNEAVSAIYERTWASLGFGFLLTILMPIIIFILFITIVGIPLAFITLLLYFILMFLSIIIGSLFLGWWVFSFSKNKKTISLGWSLVAGLVIYEILTLIPFIGGLIKAILLFLGLGGIFLGFRKDYTDMKAKKMI